MTAKKEDPAVTTFQVCLQEAFGSKNVIRVNNGSLVPKWKVWADGSEVTFSWAERWPATLKPLPLMTKIFDDGTKQLVPIARPKCLAKLERLEARESRTLLCNTTLLCACTGFLPELYGEVRLPHFPSRKIVIHINGGGQEFKHFLASIATRVTSRGLREDLVQTYAGEMSTNPS